MHVSQQQKELNETFGDIFPMPTAIEKVKLFNVNQPHLQERKFTLRFPADSL